MKKKLLGVFLVGIALFGICGCKEMMKIFQNIMLKEYLRDMIVVL